VGNLPIAELIIRGATLGVYPKFAIHIVFHGGCSMTVVEKN